MSHITSHLNTSITGRQSLLLCVYVKNLRPNHYAVIRALAHQYVKKGQESDVRFRGSKSALFSPVTGSGSRLSKDSSQLKSQAGTHFSNWNRNKIKYNYEYCRQKREIFYIFLIILLSPTL